MLGAQGPQARAWHFSKYTTLEFTERTSVYTLAILFDPFNNASSREGRYFTPEDTEAYRGERFVQCHSASWRWIQGLLTPSPVLFLPHGSAFLQEASSPITEPRESHLIQSHDCSSRAAPVA